MANEHVVRCGGAREPRGVPGAGLVELRRWGEHANVTVVVEDAGRGVRANLSDAFLDLIDLAGYVYAADQAVSRGGPADRCFGASWRRALHFHVPVRLPDFWNGTPAQEALGSALSLLSEDVYRFRFVGLADAPLREGYIPFEDERVGGPFDEVALFSGGLDSLAGAARQAIVRSRRLMLVQHRSNQKMTPQVRHLVTELGERAAGPKPFLVPVRAYKERGLTRDTDQRARSFLLPVAGRGPGPAAEPRRLPAPPAVPGRPLSPRLPPAPPRRPPAGERPPDATRRGWAGPTSARWPRTAKRKRMADARADLRGVLAGLTAEERELAEAAACGEVAALARRRGVPATTLRGRARRLLLRLADNLRGYP